MLVHEKLGLYRPVCPLEYLAWKKTKKWFRYFFQAGEALGLPEPDYHSIFRAADNAEFMQAWYQMEGDRLNRRRLLEVCRLLL